MIRCNKLIPANMPRPRTCQKCGLGPCHHATMPLPSELVTITHWAADWGDIRLPDDFPTSVLRVNGWYDKRFGIYPKVREYIDAQDAKIKRGEEKSGFAAPSFNIWMLCGGVPNRLHGAEINKAGEAV